MRGCSLEACHTLHVSDGLNRSLFFALRSAALATSSTPELYNSATNSFVASSPKRLPEFQEYQVAVDVVKRKIDTIHVNNSLAGDGRWTVANFNSCL
jgi:hypothetical protein